MPIFPTRVARKNLRTQTNFSALRIWFTTSCVYFNYFIYIIESLVMWPLRLVVIEGIAPFRLRLRTFQEDLKKRQRGMIILAGHFSNIEIMGSVVARSFESELAHNYHVLAKPARFVFLTRFLEVYRKWFGINVILTGEKTLFRRLTEIARRGESLGFINDQKPDREGIFIRFFKEWSAFPFHGVEIGVRAGMPVIFTAVVRLFPGYHRLVSHIPNQWHLVSGTVESGQIVLPTELQTRIHPSHFNEKELRTAALLAEYASWLEDLTRQHPGQWCWDYRKWSRKPPA